MNYLFSKVVVDFFIDQKTAISAIKFSDRLQEIIALYGNETSLLLWNLIDSHDTDRLASMIINPDRDYDRNGGLRDNPDYLVRKPNNDEIKILKQIVAFQMTFIGAPVIYYGDEAGMWGADDPCDRKPMLWADLDYDLEKSHALPGKTRPADQNKFDSQLFNYYKSMIELRKTNPALKIGNVEFLSEINQKDMFGFSRATEDQQILVIFNRSSSQQEIKIAQKNILYQEYFNPQNDIHYQTQDEGLVLTIPENWYAILISN